MVIAWKRGKPGAMFLDENYYVFHGLSCRTNEAYKFFVWFNLSCCCYAYLCQSSSIVVYTRCCVSSRSCGFHFISKVKMEGNEKNRRQKEKKASKKSKKIINRKKKWDHKIIKWNLKKYIPKLSATIHISLSHCL